jgi:hypothetical protein
LNLRPPGPETRNFELSDVFSIHVSGASTVQTHAIPARRSHSFSYGCPSIRAKVLSSAKYPWRCVSIAMLAREIEDEDSGKHLYLNHPLVESFCFCFCFCCCFCFCRSTNHRFGLTATMILLFEHPTRVGCESAQSTLRAVLSRPGAPASCSRCERPLNTACWCVASRRVV